MNGKNLREVYEAALLSFFWAFVHKIETGVQEGDRAGLQQTFKYDELGREARQQLGVDQKMRMPYS